MARSGSTFLTISSVLLMGCGSSDSSIGQSGPSRADASGTGGGGGAGGTGGICVGAVEPGGVTAPNIVLAQLNLNGSCLPRPLADGASTCTIVEATTDSSGAGCSLPGRRPPCSPALAQRALGRL